MSTVVELTDQEIAELKAVTKVQDVSVAIRAAMTEYIRYVRRMQLKELSGRVEMLDNWRQQEAAELKEQNGGSGTCTG
jgi:hypothetical protein